MKKILKNIIIICICRFVIILSVLVFFTGVLENNREFVNFKNLENYEKVTIAPGDIFFLTLKNTKLSSKDAEDIAKHLKKIVNIARCRPGDYYEIIYDAKTQMWTHFFYCPIGVFYYVLRRNEDGFISAEKKEHQTASEVFKKQGIIERSLWSEMTAEEIPAEIILSFADIFAWQIDFLTDVQKNDSFKVIYEIEKTSLQDAKVSSKILAAQYKTPSKTYNAFYFKTSLGTDGYFDENGRSVRSEFLKAPLQFRRISSYFTTKRFHPILKYTRPHLGIDYAAPTGTPVSAIGNGVVTMAKYSGGYGKLIIVRHLNGYETYYGHLSKYARGIKKGVRVRQGQVIGYVGMTGLATGPHLDFRIKRSGKFFNFLSMKQAPSAALTGADKRKFAEMVKTLLDELD
jgi:murein DD-endopeptidase MepM/ murein hydrolase activator NlpD